MAADNVLNTATNSLNHKQSIARGQKIGKPDNSLHSKVDSGKCRSL